jgi:L-asparaginase
MSKIVFLGTGGTIAGTAVSADDNVGYRAAQLRVETLLHTTPGLAAACHGHTVESEQVVQVDSKDMEFSHWLSLAIRARLHLTFSDVVGLVITHGTDMIEETAYFLSRVLPQDLLKNKPVVLTCAMRPAYSLATDGPQNLLDATCVAVAAKARGVMVVCAGKVHSAQHVQKVHPYRVDAFDSGDGGVWGYIEEGVVRPLQGWSMPDEKGSIVDMEKLLSGAWPRVEIVMNYVGAMGATVRALCNWQPPEVAPVRGLVVAGTGNGSIHTDMEVALREAQTQGIRVVRSTRCAWGQVVPASNLGNEFPHSNGLSPVKARIALMLDLLQ